MPFTNELAGALRGLTGKNICANVPNGEPFSEFSLEDYSLLLLKEGAMGDIQNVGGITIQVILLTGDKADIHCNVNELVDVLKLKIQLVTGDGVLDKGIPPERQRLCFSQQILERGRTIDYYGIQNGSVINFVLRLRSSAPKYFLLNSLLDAGYDYDFRGMNDGNTVYRRGGLEYIRPVGCMRCALKVTGKFDNGSDTWLGSSNGPGEWAVSFHGSHCSAVADIVRWGNQLEVQNQGGMAVFCTPDYRIALQHSNVIVDPQTNKRYKVIFQNRVKTTSIIKASTVGGPDNFWYIPNAADVRAYSICLFEQ